MMFCNTRIKINNKIYCKKILSDEIFQSVMLLNRYILKCYSLKIEEI